MKLTCYLGRHIIPGLVFSIAVASSALAQEIDTTSVETTEIAQGLGGTVAKLSACPGLMAQKDNLPEDYLTATATAISAIETWRSRATGQSGSLRKRSTRHMKHLWSMRETLTKLTN
ncbi:MAG: hypothetical protein GDA36_08875 [Rhodobacteraceae bacterium]|nr:hypothetical protein [Paracoccaceae bacterium]